MPFAPIAYDELYDCYIFPNNEILKYTTTNQKGYKEYKSNKNKCKDCPYLNQCTESKSYVKLATRHVWEEYMEQVEDIRHTVGTKEIYSKRSQTIERIFADAKELHGMMYAKHKGLAKMNMELNLLFACMNLKKLAIWLGGKGLLPSNSIQFLHFILKFIPKNIKIKRPLEVFHF